jgi:hypothetical protein
LNGVTTHSLCFSFKQYLTKYNNLVLWKYIFLGSWHRKQDREEDTNIIIFGSGIQYKMIVYISHLIMVNKIYIYILPLIWIIIRLIYLKD